MLYLVVVVAAAVVVDDDVAALRRARGRTEPLIFRSQWESIAG